MDNLDFSPNGRFLLSSCEGIIIIRNMRDGSSRMFEQSSTIVRAQFILDGRHVVAGCSSGRVLIWGLRSGQLLASLTGDTGSMGRGFAFMQDLRGFVSGNRKGAQLKRWDVDINSGLAMTQWLSAAERQAKKSDEAKQKQILTYVGQTVCCFVPVLFYCHSFFPFTGLPRIGFHLTRQSMDCVWLY
jgi:WD40 repeat protein